MATVGDELRLAPGAGTGREFRRDAAPTNRDSSGCEPSEVVVPVVAGSSPAIPIRPRWEQWGWSRCCRPRVSCRVVRSGGGQTSRSSLASCSLGTPCPSPLPRGSLASGVGRECNEACSTQWACNERYAQLSRNQQASRTRAGRCRTVVRRGSRFPRAKQRRPRGDHDGFSVASAVNGVRREAASETASRGSGRRDSNSGPLVPRLAR